MVSQQEDAGLVDRTEMRLELVPNFQPRGGWLGEIYRLDRQDVGRTVRLRVVIHESFIIEEFVLSQKLNNSFSDCVHRSAVTWLLFSNKLGRCLDTP